MANSLNYAQAIERAQALAQANKLSEAKQLLLEISTQFPQLEHASEMLAKLSRKQKFKPTDTFKKLFTSMYIKMAQNNIAAAMNGWVYVAAVDHDYLSKPQENPRTLQAPTVKTAIESESLTAPQIQGKDLQQGMDISSNHVPKLVLQDDRPETFFKALVSIQDTAQRWHWVNQFITLPSKLLCSDSYVGTSKAETLKTLQKSAPSKDLSIVILGAGCTGLALANTCKRYFGKRIDVLVIEPRVRQNHQKHVYSRNWLTNLGLPMLKPIIEPQVYDILAGFGQAPFAGTNIALLESLLLISCKQQGVKFLFDEDYTLDFVHSKNTHLLVDATGGRWNHGTIKQSPREGAHQALNVPNTDGLAASVKDFGVHENTVSNAFKLSLVFEQGLFVPHAQFENKPEQKIISHLFKVTGLTTTAAAHLKSQLLIDNPQNRFYLWPGKIKEPCNEALLLVNIHKAEFDYLTQAISKKTDLEKFLEKIKADTTPFVQTLHSQLSELLGKHDHTSAHIEPPFEYKPYFSDPQACITDFQSVPVFKIGDSLFNGHPKVGNGLGAHLIFISRIRDILLRCFGE